MSINFANLVLNPAMIVFSRPIVIDPIRSRPGEVPYKARGIFSSMNYQVPMMEGMALSDQSTWIGIRLADFEGLEPPHPRDELYIGGQRYFVSDYKEDGQGGAILQLRLVTPLEHEYHETEPQDVET